ncbi:cyclic pyranopterin monophosphate synthase MoaC [Schlesneria paludicola]|uniref:cyclic pyranopterin monophosphate synthase MoaC n=1 Tax=Schlesneria paludicola TaxID=360056 RepID=UPI000299E665|nr:cyclic pyranopterin monophosphate synthase MoaC [Schlesneria paludicola]
MSGFTHFDNDGASRMVDVGAKEITHRLARAENFVRMRPETLVMILDRQFAKGDVFEVARLAGIMATKRTADLIPLCHPLGIDGVDVTLIPVDSAIVRIEATVRVQGRTGVEMEALMAVTVAGLTIYDMCKSVDRAMTLGPARLLEKSGGKSGHFRVNEAILEGTESKLR